MNYSRRELYAMGEPLGDSTTTAKLGGGYLCGGGGSRSSSAQTTYNTDKRLAVGDGGFGISADNSSVGFTENNSFTDARSFDLYDSRSFDVNTSDSNNTTNSNNTTINAFDGGAISDAFDATKRALSSIDSAVSQTIGSNTDVMTMANNTIKLANATNADGFDKLLGVAENLFNQSQSLIGQTQASVADAYSQASSDKSGSIDNRTIIVLAVAGAAALFAFRKK
jgi:hypothetical protein